jgi:hypothetical protein
MAPNEATNTSSRARLTSGGRGVPTVTGPARVVPGIEVVDPGVRR